MIRVTQMLNRLTGRTLSQTMVSCGECNANVVVDSPDSQEAVYCPFCHTITVI